MDDVGYYAGLLEDGDRLKAFFKAIAAEVRPGDCVLEIGTGVGTYALAAAKAGAAEVHAVDYNAMAIALAREMGVGRDGVVRLHEARVEEVKLDRPADVVIFEDFSGFAYASGMRGLFDHVRGRLARAGARYVPASVELFAAPADVAVPKVGPADAGWLPFSAEGLELLRKRARSLPVGRRVEPEVLLGPGGLLGTLAMDQPIPRRVVYSGTSRCVRAGSATSLIGWMRLRFASGGEIDNTPGVDAAWRCFIFPFEEPLACEAGEEMEESIEVATGPGPKGLIWRWRLRGGGGVREGCNLNAHPGGMALLRRGSPEYVPRPASRGAAFAEVCGLVDGKLSVMEIARAVYNRHQGLFAGEGEALDFVFGALESAGGFIEDRR